MLNDRGNGLSRLHFITYDDASISHMQMAEQACRGGVELVQLRTKGKDFPAWVAEGQLVKAVCDRYGARLIVNDSAAVAKAVGAFGVHLGKLDMPIQKAREILGDGFVIGGTANTTEDLLGLIKEGVDYIGVGPFRFTTTKEQLSPVLGLDGIEKLLAAAASVQSRIPMIAVGGIEQEDIAALLRTGIHGIAVSGAIGRATAIENSAQRFVQSLQGNML